MLYHIGTAGGTRAYQNPHTAGDVVVSWSSVGYGSVDDFVQHRHVVPVRSFTSNAPSSWMQVDLGQNRSLRPTHYCLRNDNTGYGGHASRNWRLEGSNDCMTWSMLKNHTNDQSIATQNMSEANFTLDHVNERYRWFRIFQHGPNASRSNHLMCAGIELYGDLRENEEQNASCTRSTGGRKKGGRRK